MRLFVFGATGAWGRCPRVAPLALPCGPSTSPLAANEDAVAHLSGPHVGRCLSGLISDRRLRD